MNNVKTGFTFKGIHSRDMDVSFASESRPILPEQKVFSYDVADLDFEYDMTPNRPRYKSRSFTLSLYIQGDTLDDIHGKAAKISNWLQGKGILIFDDTADVEWDARVISDVGIALEAVGRAARLTVMFKVGCGEASFNVQNGISLGNAIRLESAIPFDTQNKWTYPLIAGDNTIKIMNIGNFPVRPKFNIPNGTKVVNIDMNGASINVSNISTDLVIDCSKYLLTNANGDNLMSKLDSGDFPELLPNVNEAIIYVDKPCIISVDFVPRTLHDFTFGDLDWGDENATTL